MGLPAHLLRELVTVLKADAVRKRVSDKRSLPRVGMRERVGIAPCGVRWGSSPVWVRNLSASGIGLLAGETLPVGVEFVVPFERDDAPALRILYRVSHVKKVGDGLFSIGGQMICVVEELRGAAGGRAMERRAS